MREREILVLGALVVIVLALISVTGGGMGAMMGPWMMGPWVGGGWMLLGIILFWGLIGVGMYLLLAGYVQPRRGEDSGALAIAMERYARGEITREEFDEIKRNLSRT
ncbi:MAG: SHOCT domain-containing protein [Candidatus Bathyarchaeia archaeon]